MHQLDHHAHEGVRQLFRYLLDRKDLERAKVDSLFGEDAAGVFCYLDHTSEQSEDGALEPVSPRTEVPINLETRMVPAYRRIIPALSLSVSSERPSNIRTPAIHSTTTSLQVRYQQNDRTEENGFFILSNLFDPLIVNELVYGDRLLFGPLPDFAIIQVNQCPFLW